jgi:Tol biopolymer transport system component
VAYVKESNVWLWHAERGSQALTKNGGVEQVLLSDDGQRIAFTRGGNIWVVNSDGSDERQLTTETDFESISIGPDLDPYVLAFTPYRMAWRPGSHTLFFNTIPQLELHGLFLTDDLWAVDVDTGELDVLLPPGEGGHFTFSPDGRHIALITSGTISLLDGNGQNKREVFTYTPMRTYSEFQYYAQPVWANDSSLLAVAIPPVDPLETSDQLTSIWTMSTDGTPASLIGHFATHNLAADSSLLSPDLRHIAFFIGESEATPPAFGVAVSEIGKTGVGDPVTYQFRAGSLDGWSPDGRHFVFAPPYNGEVPQRQIATLDGDLLTVGEEGMTVFQVIWVDETHYLYLQHGGRGWTLFLSELGGESPTVIDGIVGGPPQFDFAVVLEPVDSAAPSSTTVSSDDDDEKVSSDFLWSSSSQSPDGLWIAESRLSYVMDGDSAQGYDTELLVSRADGSAAWTLVDTVQNAGLGYTVPEIVRWTPDGQQVYFTNRAVPDGCGLFVNGSDLFRADLSTGEVVELMPSLARALSLSPDETSVAYFPWGPEPDLVLRDLGNGSEIYLSWEISFNNPGNIVWSPDGQDLLLTLSADTCLPGWAHTIVRVNTTSMTPTVLIENDQRQFTIIEWTEPERALLQDKDGRSWWLDTTTGEVTAQA